MKWFLSAGLVSLVLVCPFQSSSANSLQQTAYGRHAVVVSCERHASEAGIDAIAAGGNAVDGAVATAFALAVTCPRAGNLGGGGFALIRTPKGEVISNDHREKAPALATRDMFLDETGKPSSALSLNSVLAAGVPGTVAGLLDMHERFGVLPRSRVMAASIRLARKGFPVSHDLAEQLKRRLELFSRSVAATQAFTRRNKPYQPGEILRQPDLARTLIRIRDSGRDGFYKGVTADLLVAKMKADGGLISHADLENYSSVWRSPVSGDYRGYRLYSMAPPSSGGVLLVWMLNMLEKLAPAQLTFASSEFLHHLIEIQRRAYAGRSFGDPDFYHNDIELLTSKAFAARQFSGIDPERASVSTDIRAEVEPRRRESTETTHLSVMDKDGWMVSLTTTLNASFGSKIMVDGAGFLLNNEMDDFATLVGAANLYGLVGRSANQIEPNKRMLSSMTPTLILKDGQPFMALGSPGGSAIINSVLQVIVNVLDRRMPLGRAVGAGRIHHQWQPDRVFVEAWTLSPDVLAALEGRGHRNFSIRKPDDYSGGIGVVNAVMRRADGTLHGVADFRRSGAAAGMD